MAGSNQSERLQGMLVSLANDVGRGNLVAGQQLTDNVRRIAAPKPNMDDPDSLDAYADWAMRNGYDEEANRYRAAAYQQRQMQGQRAYGKQVAGMDAAMKQINDNIIKIQNDPSLTPEQKQQQIASHQQAMQTLKSRMNTYGNENPYGLGNEGRTSMEGIQAANAAAAKAQLERRKMQSQIAENKANAAAKASEAQQIAYDQLIATSVQTALARGATTPPLLPEGHPLIYLNDEIRTQFKQGLADKQAIQDASLSGTVTDPIMQKAKSLAESNDAVRLALDSYNNARSQSITSSQAGNAAKALTAAVQDAVKSQTSAADSDASLKRQALGMAEALEGTSATKTPFFGWGLTDWGEAVGDMLDDDDLRDRLLDNMVDSMKVNKTVVDNETGQERPAEPLDHLRYAFSMMPKDAPTEADDEPRRQAMVMEEKKAEMRPLIAKELEERYGRKPSPAQVEAAMLRRLREKQREMTPRPQRMNNFQAP